MHGFQRLLCQLDTENILMFQVLFHILSEQEDLTEILQKIYEDVPDLLLKLLHHKNAPKVLV